MVSSGYTKFTTTTGKAQLSRKVVKDTPLTGLIRPEHLDAPDIYDVAIQTFARRNW